MRAKWLVGIALVSSAGLQPPGASAAPVAPGDVRVTLLDARQADVLRRGAVRVRVRSRVRGAHVISMRAGGRGVARRTVVLRPNRSRTVRLALTQRGRRTMASCRTRTLRVRATRGRRAGFVTSTYVLDHRRCRPRKGAGVTSERPQVLSASSGSGVVVTTTTTKTTTTTTSSPGAGKPARPGSAPRPVETPAAASRATKAGVATVDATWHVGASAGQFSDEGGAAATPDSPDPHGHTTKKRRSDGVGVRTTIQALVFEDAEGDRVAIVGNDLYLSQNLLNRRVGTLLARNSKLGIDHKNLAISASHNHQTPFYSTPGWGTAVFQDVFDLRFYDYISKQMAKAVEQAAEKMVPVRIGGATTTFDGIQSHTYGPQLGDDGAPAGQPQDHTTKQVSVVRVDDISDARKPRRMANWVVFGVHPEYGVWGGDLISGDIIAATKRMVDRRLGTDSVFSQRETGTSGPHKDTRAHQPEARREFQDMGFADLDRAARLLADAIVKTTDAIAEGTPERRSAYQPFVTDADVETVSQYFAPPATRPYPGVSNCNTMALFHGDPRLPILGLPDCQSTPAAPVTGQLKPVTAPMYDQLKEAGVPIPESISATKLTAVEETSAIHMMAIKLGGIIATANPSEQFTDTALNIESRLDKVEGNIYKGFSWVDRKTPAGRDWCVKNGTGGWLCADPRNPAQDLALTDVAYRRFVAQTKNDARGWENDLATLGSEAEPADPDKIKGAFTHEEFPQRGYNLVLALGMTNDYWGYMPEYRDYRGFDHYRKALSGLGPHGADFLATRLSRLAASLNGGEKVQPTPLDVASAAEQARAQVVADGLGETASAAAAAYEASLPADGGAPRILDEPTGIKRFSATHLKFVGGSNYADLPDVRVERRQGQSWEPYADMDGDVQLMVDFPGTEQLAAVRAGGFEWKWTAAFEAFSSDISQPDDAGKDRASTPAGTYRFVVDGRRQTAQGRKGYRLESRPFTVAPWDGITAEDLRVEADGTVSFRPGPVSEARFGDRTYKVGPIDYPDSYGSPFRFLQAGRKLYTYGLSDPARHQQYCPRCSFRPWADTGRLAEARVTIRATDGAIRTVAATQRGDGRWGTAAALEPGETAYVEAGALRDEFGETNGARSAAVTR